MRDGLIYAEAGVASPKVARFAASQSFAEAEFLAGIPGTVGGALAMNAGCYGGETWRYVARVEVLTRAGMLRVAASRRVCDRIPLGAPRRWRRRPTASSPRRGSRFRRAMAASARARIAELLRRRIATQPLDLPNAGSVFRNPPGDHAARLIESCGLKGYADRRRAGVGEAREFHRQSAGRGEGRRHRSDHRARTRRRRARARPGIDLEPEVPGRSWETAQCA